MKTATSECLKRFVALFVESNRQMFAFRITFKTLAVFSHNVNYMYICSVDRWIFNHPKCDEKWPNKKRPAERLSVREKKRPGFWHADQLCMLDMVDVEMLLQIGLWTTEFSGCFQVNREINCSRHTRSLCRIYVYCIYCVCVYTAHSIHALHINKRRKHKL